MPPPVANLLRDISLVAWAVTLGAALFTGVLWTVLLASTLRRSPRM